MSARSFGDNPWPVQTPAPQTPLPTRHRQSLKRIRPRSDASASTSKSARRQVVPNEAQVEEALTSCYFLSANDVISCWPTSDTVIAQHQWASLVWNSRRPQLTQTNLVNIYLLHGDSRDPVLSFIKLKNPSNQAGRINVQVNDSWWGSNGDEWDGKNISYPFYWVVLPSTTTLDSNAIAQATFSAVQTTFADSVIVSIESASSASASAAAIASSSSSAAEYSRTATQSSTKPSTSSAALQSPSSGSDFPHWAIAVIVVLGFLAIAATGLLAFLIIRRVRRQNPSMASNHGSMTSASPMIPNAGGLSSPLLAGAAIAGHPSGGEEKQRGDERDEPSVAHDGASTISRAGSANVNEGPFSSRDAEIMADAFRKKLRNPEFAGQPVEEAVDGEGSHEKAILSRELAEEGRDIRSVRSERGVKVETSDAGGLGT